MEICIWHTVETNTFTSLHNDLYSRCQVCRYACFQNLGCLWNTPSLRKGIILSLSHVPWYFTFSKSMFCFVVQVCCTIFEALLWCSVFLVFNDIAVCPLYIKLNSWQWSNFVNGGGVLHWSVALMFHLFTFHHRCCLVVEFMMEVKFMKHQRKNCFYIFKLWNSCWTPVGVKDVLFIIKLI